MSELIKEYLSLEKNNIGKMIEVFESVGLEHLPIMSTHGYSFINKKDNNIKTLNVFIGNKEVTMKYTDVDPLSCPNTPKDILMSLKKIKSQSSLL